MNQHAATASISIFYLASYLRGFIPWLRKRLSLRRRKRLGLSLDGVVKKTINKEGRKTLLLVSNIIAIGFYLDPREYCLCVPAEVGRASAQEDTSIPPEVLLPCPAHASEVCCILPGTVMIMKVASMIIRV